MKKTMNYKSSYMKQLFRKRNLMITKEERRLASLNMYENYLCQYKAILLQCERDYELMINVRLYQEIVVPFFTVKHGQFAAVALVRSGANKLLRKVWEAFILRRDRIMLKEHNKSLSNQKKYETQLENAQLSAGQQIDKRVDQNLAELDAKVKSIIRDTVKSHSIKTDAIDFDHSLLDCELTGMGTNVKSTQYKTKASISYNQFDQQNPKKARKQSYIDLRSPISNTSSNNQDTNRGNRRFTPQPKGYL